MLRRERIYALARERYTIKEELKTLGGGSVSEYREEKLKDLDETINNAIVDIEACKLHLSWNASRQMGKDLNEKQGAHDPLLMTCNK